MTRRFVSGKSRLIQRRFKDVRYYISAEYYEGADLDTLEVYNNVLIQSIEEIDTLLRHQSVRGHRDPTILSPDVNRRSSPLRILQRLERQINAACILADVAHLGPEANAHEAEALSRVEQVLEQLYETISSETSLRGSGTDSE